MEKRPILRVLALVFTLLAGTGWQFAAFAESPDSSVTPGEGAVAESVDINSASASVLADALDGVGSHRAEAIVAYRDKHGEFESPEELLEVTGIGAATLEKNRDRLGF